ncbi:MAG TPA: glycosyltransferase [Nitrosomonas halophila]|nr:glycosyltransferase [Nitrosomonas halophila]
MHVSIIIPAFNEERLIEQCLQSVADAMAANQSYGYSHEVIVVDNNSTDDTARLAKQAGARVVFEPVNQIARARAAGAAAATGDWFIFLDADCLLNAGLVGEIFSLIEQGKHVGAGSTLHMPNLPWWMVVLLRIWTALSVKFSWAAGALIACDATVFREVGGFNQALYAAEEVDLSQKLKKWGRARKRDFTILTDHPLETSSRKVQLYSSWEIAGQFLRLILHPFRTLQSKERLSMWYDGRR